MVSIDDTLKEEDLDSPFAKKLRHAVLEIEAKDGGSDIKCPYNGTLLPKRAPFFGWDNEKGKPSYYCTVCDKYFFIP